MPFSRRDFLKVGGLLAASAALSSCIKVENVPIQLNLLNWRGSPLQDLESGPSTTLRNVTHFGPNDGLRIVSFERTLITNQLDSLVPNIIKENQKNERDMIQKFFDEKIEKVIIIQKKALDPVTGLPLVDIITGREIWEPLRVPGTRLSMNMADNISRNINEQLNQPQLNNFAFDLKEYHNVPDITTPSGEGLADEIARRFAISEVTKVLMDPNLTDKEAKTIISQFLYSSTLFPQGGLPGTWADWQIYSSIMRTDSRLKLSDIPESISIKNLLDIYKAVLSPFGDEVYKNVDGVDYTDAQIIDAITANSGLAAYDCIFVPKQSDSEQNEKLNLMFDELKKKFVEIPKKPRVFKANLAGEDKAKIYVIHDMNNVIDIHEAQVTWDDSLNEDLIKNKIDASGNPIQWLGLSETPEEGKTMTTKEIVEILVGEVGKIVELQEFPADVMGWFLVPNKGVGLGKKRLDPGIMFKSYASPEDRINNISTDSLLMLGEKILDSRLNPIQPKDQIFFESYITDVTENINKNFIAKGIDRVYIEGLLTSTEWVSRALRGTLNNDFNDYGFLMPSDPYMVQMMAGMKMTDLLEERGIFETGNPNKGENMVVFLNDVPLKRIDLKEFYLGQVEADKVVMALGGDIESESYRKFVNIFSFGKGRFNIDERKIFDLADDTGRPVKMQKGDFFPIETIVEINDIKYLILKQKGGPGLFAVEKSLIAVPLEEAMKDVLLLDFDNNIAEAVKTFAFTALAIGLIIAPETVGGLIGEKATLAGSFVKKNLMKIFTSIGSKLIQGGEKILSGL